MGAAPTSFRILYTIHLSRLSHMSSWSLQIVTYCVLIRNIKMPNNYVIRPSQQKHVLWLILGLFNDTFQPHCSYSFEYWGDCEWWNDKKGPMKVDVPYFEVTLKHSLGCTKENHEHFVKITDLRAQNSNLVSSEYEAARLTTWWGTFLYS
jgi:hypothetical protein